jgi:uncharacterized protein (TIGR02996 family)
VTAELEQAVIAAPDDPAAYLVYADWLQAQGDPRGELIVVHHRAPDDAGELIERHAAHLLGPFATAKPETFHLEWQLGFIKKATIGWETPGDDAQGAFGGSEHELVAFLRLPSARFIQELALGPIPGEDDMSLCGLAAAIEAVRPPCLRKLYLGDTANWDISSTSTAAPSSESVPRLQSLTLHGGSIDIGAMDLPALRELAVQTGHLTKRDLAELRAAKLPELEDLEIWFGDPNYGATGDLDDIAPILSGEAFPKLTRLGLMNCAFADAIAAALPAAKILPQLRRLDLSMGNLSDRGLAVMLEHTAAFAALERLDVSDNALTDASWPAARALAKHVTFGVEHDPDRAVPRDDSNRYARYVSVGE